MLDSIRAFCIALGVAAPVAAAAVQIPVADDASVVESNPDGNYATNTFEGGLFVGTDGTPTEARFYLKFALPAFVPGTFVSSAILTGTYNDELIESADGLHGIFLVGVDSWSELTLTWNNQPGPSGGALAVWDPSLEPVRPVSQSFDLTTATDQQYQGDSTLSLVFAPLDPAQDLTWEYWSSKEHTAQPGFSLDVTIAPVPEPATALLVALGGAALGIARRPRGATRPYRHTPAYEARTRNTRMNW